MNLYTRASAMQKMAFQTMTRRQQVVNLQRAALLRRNLTAHQLRRMFSTAAAQVDLKSEEMTLDDI